MEKNKTDVSVKDNLIGIIFGIIVGLLIVRYAGFAWYFFFPVLLLVSGWATFSGIRDIFNEKEKITKSLMSMTIISIILLLYLIFTLVGLEIWPMFETW